MLFYHEMFLYNDLQSITYHVVMIKAGERDMRKILVSLIVIGLLLTASILTVNARSFCRKLKENNQINGDGTVDYWGICVGVGEGIAADKNAEVMKYVLCDHGFIEDHMMLLTNEDATKKNFLDALSWLNDSADYDDVVIVCIQAHGHIGALKLYDRYLWYHELDDELDKLNSANIGVIINSCYSGSAIPYLRQVGRIILTDMAANESGGPNVGAVFGALQGYGDYFGDNDNKVSVEELYDFLVQPGGGSYHGPQIDDNITGELDISFIDDSNCNPDQFQRFFNLTFPANMNGIVFAQSFKPSFDKINRVKLFIGKNGNPGPLNISIKENLTGENLISVEVPEEDILPIGDRVIANNFYFPEIEITPGETYYIVCKAKGTDPGTNTYFLAHSDTVEGIDAYENGSMVYSFNGETWHSVNSDLCFVTFYYENLRPAKPVNLSGPTSGAVGKSYNYSTSTIDLEGDEIYYWFDWGDRTYSGWLGPYNSGENVTAAHKWTKNGTYDIRVKAKDIHGTQSEWSNALVVTLWFAPNPPIIDGPINGEVSIEYEYTFNATDPEGHDVYYYVDWGDSTNTGWFGPYSSGREVMLSHTWDEKGDYVIKAKALDLKGAESDWSSFILRIGNQAPDAPTITGPIHGEKGEEYNYTFVTTDPEKDDIYYEIEWGDGTNITDLGPCESGEEVILNHTWTEQGAFTIRAKVKDIYGAESDWSTLRITMPLNQPSGHSNPQSNPQSNQQSSPSSQTQSSSQQLTEISTIVGSQTLNR